MALDWFSGTSDCEPDRLRSVVDALVAAKVPGAGVREARPTLAFAHAVEWIKDEKRLAAVQWGGTNHVRPHVVVPGAGGLSGFVRQELATTGYGFTTSASRVDVAMDFRGVPFAALSAVVGSGKAPTRKVENADPMHGDTHYFGSRQSRHMVRVYEKGKQMHLEDLSDWVRVEVEVKPDKRAGRYAAMTATHAELIRSGRYGRRIADAVGVDAEPLRMGAARRQVPHDLMRRLTHLRRQYGTTISELLALCGDDGRDLFIELLVNGPTALAMEDLADLADGPV